MSITDEVALARQARLARTWNINPVMAEVVDALLDLSGAAHRDTVAATVARRRGRGPASEGLRREIFEVVAVHCEKAKNVARPALVHLPFGEGSYRWALTPEVVGFMHHSRPAVRSVRRPFK